MRLRLPFAEEENFELEQRGEELTVAVKNERRRFSLPDVLKGREVEGARFQDGELVLDFREDIAGWQAL